MVDLRKESFPQELMEEYRQRLRRCRSVEDIVGKDGPLGFLLKDTVEAMLKEEMTDHLGYRHGDADNKSTDNARNGYHLKTLKTSYGKAEIHVPRDRKGKFVPKIIPKHKTTTSELENRIISMYAKGMTTTDIATHLSEIYLGTNVSAMFISHTTEKILHLAKAWQTRPLDKMYPVVFFDAIHFKVRDSGKVVSKAVHVVLAINAKGRREVLGFYVAENEGAKFWLRVLADLVSRGVKDILIACVDGLKGLPETIRSIYPDTDVQLCVVHQIRNSLRCVSIKDRREFASYLKDIYTADTEELAWQKLNHLNEIWGHKYSIVIRSWCENWMELTSFFKYSPLIRKMIYTTNIIEGFHRQLRKVTKNRGVFPNGDSLFKLLYLATEEVSRKWTVARHSWSETIRQLSLRFGERVP